MEMWRRAWLCAKVLKEIFSSYHYAQGLYGNVTPCVAFKKMFRSSPNETKWDETKWIQWSQVSLSETKRIQVKPNETKWSQTEPSELHSPSPQASLSAFRLVLSVYITNHEVHIHGCVCWKTQLGATSGKAGAWQGQSGCQAGCWEYGNLSMSKICA